MKYFLFVAVLVLGSCNSEKPIKENPTTDSKTQTQPLKNPHQVFLVNVNQLRLRDAPGRDSKTIAKLAQNTVVYSQNKRSELIDTIELRMRRFIEPYYQVQTEAGSGWIYGGGLTKIYEGAEAIQVPQSIGKLVKDLKGIPKDKISVGGWMANRISDEDMSEPRVNDLYLAIAVDALRNTEYENSFYEETENAGFSDEDYGAIFDRKFDYSSNAYAQRAYDNGHYLDAGEGMIYPVISIQRMADIIGGPFTEATKAYADLDDFVYQNPYMTDASIFAPLELVAKVYDRRVAFQESYPNTAWNNYNQEAIQWTWSDLKYGSSNTPAFDYPNKPAFPEFRISWSNIIKQYDDRPWIKDFEKWVERVKVNGWKNPDIK